MGIKYHRQIDGEWVAPRHRGYRMGCCDCGLVHVVNFRIRDGRVQMQATRHPQATAAMRRREQVKR